MRVQILAVTLFLTPLACHCETLRELLAKSQLPLTAFSQKELAETVQGEDAIHEGRTVLAYQETEGDSLVGPLHLARFGPGNNHADRRDLPIKPDENCYGSLLGISFLHDLTMIDMHISPSASCLLVLDDRFQIVRKLFGFDWHEVSPYQVAIIEDMIHFAPVHPVRLLIDNLLHFGSIEVYPPKNDPLRKQFIAENSKHMPSDEICRLSDDPCAPEEFDEDIMTFATDGKGRFAFLASLNAMHSPAKDQPLESVWTQTGLYIYQRDGFGWLYCEKEVSDAKVESVRGEISLLLDRAEAPCTPNLRVIPDRATASFSPFTTD
jgi:hypothetical protein